MSAVAWLLLLAAVAAAVGARIGWEIHDREHVLARAAWAIVGAIMAMSFVFAWLGACLDESGRDPDDPARYPGRYRDL